MDGWVQPSPSPSNTDVTGLEDITPSSAYLQIRTYANNPIQYIVTRCTSPELFHAPPTFLPSPPTYSTYPRQLPTSPQLRTYLLYPASHCKQTLPPSHAHLPAKLHPRTRISCRRLWRCMFNEPLTGHPILPVGWIARAATAHRPPPGRLCLPTGRRWTSETSGGRRRPLRERGDPVILVSRKAC